MWVNELHASCYLQPKDIAKYNGNVMRDIHGAMKLRRLHFKANMATWMSEEELDMFAEEGRFWAEKILHAIQFFARRCERTLGSFLKDDSNGLNTYEVVDVVDTCERCLERLRPEIFFSKEETVSQGMIQPLLLIVL